MSIRQLKWIDKDKFGKDWSFDGTNFFLIIFMIIIFLISGCSRGKRENVTTLNFLAPAWPGEITRMGQIIAKFEKANPGVKVRATYTSDLRQKILMTTTADLPLDIVYLYDTAFPGFVDKKIFQPLNEFIEKDKNFDLNDFYPSAISIGTFGGKIYAIPPMFGTISIIYNRALFKKAGVPYPKEGWSWEEFREACRKLTIDQDGDGKPEQFGAMGTEGWFWMVMIFQNGGRILDENGKCVFNSKEVLETLQFMMDMFTKDRVFVGPTTFPGAFSADGGMTIDSASLFINGKVAMWYAGSDITKNFPADLDWDIAAQPEKKGGKKYFHVGFFGYAITSASKNKDLAWEFVKFLTSKEIIRDWIDGAKQKKWETQGVPSRKSLTDEVYALYPGKNMKSYLYCLQYPEFALAQAAGIPAWQEAVSRYDYGDIVRGRVKGDLKDTLDKLTKEVNKNLTLSK